MNTTTTASTLDLLDRFVNQRPGFETANYDSASDYRADYRTANNHLHDYRALRSLFIRVCNQEGVDADKRLRDTLETATGRLTMEGGRLEYCTGQYFPTEYRGAACRVLASATWVLLRRDMDYKGMIQYVTRNAGRSAAGWFR